jgi:S-phase kinase-associated protein 1
MNNKITLVTKENERVVINKEIACGSNLIKEMLSEDSSSDIEIPLPAVTKASLLKAIEFLEYHHNKPMAEIEKPLKSTNLKEVIADEWDLNYINIENKYDLFQLIMTANYLDIKDLLHLAGATIMGRFIKNKTPGEVRKAFDLPEESLETHAT